MVSMAPESAPIEPRATEWVLTMLCAARYFSGVFKTSLLVWIV